MGLGLLTMGTLKGHKEPRRERERERERTSLLKPQPCLLSLSLSQPVTNNVHMGTLMCQPLFWVSGFG